MLCLTCTGRSVILILQEAAAEVTLHSHVQGQWDPGGSRRLQRSANCQGRPGVQNQICCLRQGGAALAGRLLHSCLHSHSPKQGVLSPAKTRLRLGKKPKLECKPKSRQLGKDKGKYNEELIENKCNLLCNHWLTVDFYTDVYVSECLVSLVFFCWHVAL